MQKAAPMALRACRTVRSAASRGDRACSRISLTCRLRSLACVQQRCFLWHKASGPAHRQMATSGSVPSPRTLCITIHPPDSGWKPRFVVPLRLVLPWSKCWVFNWWQGTPYTKQMINKLKVKSTVTEKDLKPLQFALAIKNMGQKGGQCNGHILFPTDLKWTFEICLLLRFANCKRSAKSTR